LLNDYAAAGQISHVCINFDIANYSTETATLKYVPIRLSFFLNFKGYCLKNY